MTTQVFIHYELLKSSKDSLRLRAIAQFTMKNLKMIQFEVTSVTADVSLKHIKWSEEMLVISITTFVKATTLTTR